MKHSHEHEITKEARTTTVRRMLFVLSATAALQLTALEAQEATNVEAVATNATTSATTNATVSTSTNASAAAATVAAAPAPRKANTTPIERAKAGTFTSALESQIQDIPQPAPAVKQGPLTFEEKAERVGLVLLSILAFFHFGPKGYRKWKARPDAWAEMQSEVVDVSSGTVGEQISFSQFASKLQTTAGSPPVSTDQPGLQQYLKIAPQQIAALRKTFSEIEGAVDEENRKQALAKLYSDLQAFRTLPGLQAHYSAWELSGALEGLLKQMTSKTENVTPSTLRTAEAALVLLEELSRAGVKPDLSRVPPVRLLVVDDDPISRVAVSSSLKKVFNEPDVAADGNVGRVLAEKNGYDLAFLDIEMPGIDGYELCAKIRETQINASTPVVFVTRHSDFDARVKSARSGGQDLIAKPFLSFEITVKALTMVLRRRLAGGVTVVSAEPVKLKEISEGTKGTQATKAAEETKGTKGSEVATSSVAAQPKVTVQNSTAAASAPSPEAPRGKAPTFFAQAPTHIEAIRHQLQALGYAGPEVGNTDIFRNVNLSMLWLGAEAERAGMQAAARLSASLQALMKKLLDNRTNVSPSTLAAAGAAVDLLEELCTEGANPDLNEPRIRILVVDDDPIARRAMSAAIQLAFPKPDSADTGEEAVAKAGDTRFDVVFLDIQMPGMDGFEACGKIHQTSLNAQTPVLFVTSHSDLKSREKATESGGCGFIPKPVLAAEITLQALTLILRARLGRAEAEPIRELVSQ